MADKNIEMNLLTEFKDNLGEESKVAVVADSAAPRFRLGTASEVYTVKDVTVGYGHGIDSVPSFFYDNGCRGWGFVRLPNDDMARAMLKNVKSGDKVRVFRDGRGDNCEIIAITNLVDGTNLVDKLGGKRLWIKPVPYAWRDMKNFTHRYLPRLSDKIAFNWAMIVTIIANGGRVRLNAADNLRTVLEYGKRQQYLDKLLNQEIAQQR